MKTNSIKLHMAGTRTIYPMIPTHILSHAMLSSQILIYLLLFETWLCCHLLRHLLHTSVGRRSSVVEEERLLPVVIVCLENVPRAVASSDVPHVDSFCARPGDYACLWQTNVTYTVMACSKTSYCCCMFFIYETHQNKDHTSEDRRHKNHISEDRWYKDHTSKNRWCKTQIQ